VATPTVPFGPKFVSLIPQVLSIAETSRVGFPFLSSIVSRSGKPYPSNRKGA
jgi:hypothetical protein